MKNTTILVVEGHDAVQQLLNWVLKYAGFEVEIAGDGADAVALARRNHYDAVLLDINLPHTSGEQVFQKLKAASDAPIIVMGGALLYISELTERIPDAQGYFLKPLDLNGLVSTLQLLVQPSPLLERAVGA